MNVEPNTNRDYSGMASIPDYRSYSMGSRGISLEVVDHFQVKMSVDPEGKPASHFYPYTRDGQTVAYKDRQTCLLYTSPSPRDRTRSRMPSSA